MWFAPGGEYSEKPLCFLVLKDSVGGHFTDRFSCWFKKHLNSYYRESEIVERCVSREHLSFLGRVQMGCTVLLIGMSLPDSSSIHTASGVNVF